MLRPVIFVPLINRDEVAFFVAGRAGKGIKSGAVFCVGGEVMGHLVVDFQDAEFGAVSAIIPEVFAFDDGESFHDVIHCVTWSWEIGQKFRGALGLPV